MKQGQWVLAKDLRKGDIIRIGDATPYVWAFTHDRDDKWIRFRLSFPVGELHIVTMPDTVKLQKIGNIGTKPTQ